MKCLYTVTERAYYKYKNQPQEQGDEGGKAHPTHNCRNCTGAIYSPSFHTFAGETVVSVLHQETC